MFQFRRFPTYDYFIHHRLLNLLLSGFPHSDTHGSMAAFAYPWLFADCCVLRRLLVPRHSPCALCSLTLVLFFTRHFSKIVVYPILSFSISCFHFTFFLYSVFKVRLPYLYDLVGPSGLEPPTSRLSGVRSNLLSYEPISLFRRCPLLPWWR